MEITKDYLDELIEEHSQDPEFAQRWRAAELMLQLVRIREEQGLSQQAVADRLEIARTRVAEMERNPAGVAFERALAYAEAVGARVQIVAPKKPRLAKTAAPKRGRPVGGGKAKTLGA